MELTSRPDSGLFFKSADSNDIRLGALVQVDRSAYEYAKFVVLSCGQDEGIWRNSGRAGAALAPTEIRRSFYKLTAPSELQEGDLMDLGDTSFDGSLEEIHERHFQVVHSLLEDGKKVLILGGGNDLSYPDGKAMQAAFSNFIAVNVDAHLDIRKNDICNSGTPYRQLIEERLLSPQNFFEIGIQLHANSVAYIEDAKKWGIGIVYLNELYSSSITDCLEKTIHHPRQSTTMLGFDMDAIKAADAPGVSAPSPIGLTAEQAQFLVAYLSEFFSVEIMEITEVNPLFDIDFRTSKTAAILMHTYITKNL